ncbi:MAG: DEAD/DEAH box helicase family protein [Verrucomicrobiota bacterium]|nr:DEAD/DEAH box helicase family protein [Verrucomicrobiota bacterium]
MPRKRKDETAQLGLLEAKVSTAPCVPGIRDKVKGWREGGYKGVTGTTRILLNHWFYTDHRLPNGRKFEYHHFQRHAVETLIYLYEVAKLRRHKNLVETFATRSDLRLLQYDEFPRYCVKMATGSGKTKVMSLAMAWQFFNAAAEGRDDFAKTFLLIAPNVIVFERLRKDFAGGRIFQADPVIPNELRVFWDFQCYMRGDGERASSLGALYLTNVQQFYDRENGESDEPMALREVLGTPPPAQKLAMEDFSERIIARKGTVAVINDEAHHTHDEESEWNKTIRNLHKQVSGGLAAQFDFTATPRHSKGQLFSWTVFDYTIPQPQTAEEVIGYYARRIAQDVKLPSQFSTLAPKVREFLENKAFGQKVNLQEPAMLKAISSNVAQYVTIKTFREALSKLVMEDLKPQLLHGGRSLMETPPFPWSRATLAADKCVFNLVPCANEFEKEFARFLQKADDVERFAKLPEQFGFAIEYTDNVGNLRYYEPDFVVLANDGTHYIVETKGLEDVNVAHKKRAAELWCENTSKLTGKSWAYLLVRQKDYTELQPTTLNDLIVGSQTLV